jgi:hypothetical protein
MIDRIKVDDDGRLLYDSNKKQAGDGTTAEGAKTCTIPQDSELERTPTVGHSAAPELIVYREFDDGSDEIGVLTYDTHGFWIHVGDFDYYLCWPQARISDVPFMILGQL